MMPAGHDAIWMKIRGINDIFLRMQFSKSHDNDIQNICECVIAGTPVGDDIPDTSSLQLPCVQGGSSIFRLFPPMTGCDRPSPAGTKPSRWCLWNQMTVLRWCSRGHNQCLVLAPLGRDQSQTVGKWRRGSDTSPPMPDWFPGNLVCLGRTEPGNAEASRDCHEAIVPAETFSVRGKSSRFRATEAGSWTRWFPKELPGHRTVRLYEEKPAGGDARRHERRGGLRE